MVKNTVKIVSQCPVAQYNKFEHTIKREDLILET